MAQKDLVLTYLNTNFSSPWGGGAGEPILQHTNIIGDDRIIDWRGKNVLKNLFWHFPLTHRIARYKTLMRVITSIDIIGKHFSKRLFWNFYGIFFPLWRCGEAASTHKLWWAWPSLSIALVHISFKNSTLSIPTSISSER